MSRELLKQIEARFRSGNSVPVERAHITADEWASKSDSSPRNKDQ